MKLFNLTKRYLLALGLIATLSISAFCIVYWVIHTQETYASIINISGRQRMLSQKAALLGTQLLHCKNEAEEIEIRNQLYEVKTLLEISHKGLISGNAALNLPGKPSKEIQNLYFSSPVLLDQQIRTFISHIDSLLKEPGQKLTYNNPHLVYLQNAARGELLKSLDSVVKQYELEAQQHIKRLQFLEIIIVSLTLMLLLFEALFIFRPLVRHVYKETSQLRNYNNQLQVLSSYDSLTGIANRRFFDQHLAKEWEGAVISSSWLSLILIDIDFFKNFNDTYGHQAGDRCLAEVASALHASLNRSSDFVARYGGEEFAVILPDTDCRGAMLVAEKLRREIENLRIPHAKSAVADYVTVSIGVSSTMPVQYNNPEKLIAEADDALYSAKRAGRNRVMHYVKYFNK